MTVIIETYLLWAPTALSRTWMTSLTSIFLVYFVTNIAFAFSLDSHLHIVIECSGDLTLSFGFLNFHVMCSTLAHAQMNHHVAKFGHWNQQNADIFQNWYTICFSLRYVFKNWTLPINSSADAWAVTMSLSESKIYIVIGSRPYAKVRAYWFNRHHFQQRWLIALCGAVNTRCARVWLRFHRTPPNMTTSLSRSPLWHLRYSRYHVKTIQKLSNCCRYRCRSIMIHLLLNKCQNRQCRCAVLLIAFREEIGCVFPCWWCHFVEFHLLLTNPLQAVPHRFCDCAHHPAWFVLFAQLALHSLLIILIFPIFPISGTCEFTQTVFDNNHHLLKSISMVSVRQSHVFTFPRIFQFLLNRFLCIFNLLACASGLSLSIILNRLYFVLMP